MKRLINRQYISSIIAYHHSATAPVSQTGACYLAPLLMVLLCFLTAFNPLPAAAAGLNSSNNSAVSTTIKLPDTHNPDNQFKLPELGDSSAGLMPPAQEQALGQAWLRSFRASVPLESDPLLFEYMEDLLLMLASYSDLDDKSLDLVVVKNPNINAFAVPGGVVGVNTGLVLYAETEAQLASVLSHELAHLSQRHFARSVEASKRASFASIAGLLAGIALAVASEGDAAQAAIITSQAAVLDSQLRYSRLHEREADRLGMRTLVQAGYPAEAAANMFKQMLNASRLYGNRIPEFLLTHPVTESRISDASNRARQLPAQPAMPSMDYQLVKTRVKILSEGSSKDSIKHFRLALSQFEHPESGSPKNVDANQQLNEDAARYGLALAYNRNRDARKARETLKPLLHQVPGKIAYTLLDIEIDIESGKRKQAERRLRGLNALIPNNYAIAMLLAETLLANKEYTSAQKVLSDLSKSRPNQADIWYMLAETHGLAGDILKLHQARAEFFLLRGNFSQSRQHLKQALNLSRDNYQTIARIKQRVRDINTLQRITENL